MKTKNVAMLVRKDLRMSKWVFVAGVGIWLMPLAICIVHSIVTGVPQSEVFRDENLVTLLSGFSWMLVFIIPMLVGHVLASEQADRSAAFLAYMPFTRGEAVAGKAICAMLLAAALVGLFVSATTIDMAIESWSWWRSMHRLAGFSWTTPLASYGENIAEGAGFVLPALAVVFGSAWLAGVCLKSSAWATALGVIMPILLWTSIVTYAYVTELGHSSWDWQSVERYLGTSYVGWSMALGIVFFVVGVVVFLRRKPEV